VKTFYENLPSRKSFTTELVDEVKEYNIKKILETFK